ncbi:putative methyltransferase [Actinoplanes missouriensis 431]|uniref:Putative methyltransferase n=1 Tax=Actinoplanes missouriensis (strain ATCC 14538 / DSM 43046 / CBS 188.64 / JCM 3121 / NBRC 102363 / NCIMB 12654 / NRRL B-3342 / UNCC 431) TaxID=512565 RepID=I0H8Y4_ACTM4|nr:class I SAM-dependent methyltransferase [Actinoplanes missouriensis]BAL89471.1 putative methyltransferase [Actinoplanes missouriensis 431]
MTDIEQAYENVSGLYIDLFGSVESAHAEDLALIARHLGGRVVDAGCGPGHLTGYLRGLGADVTGIDLTPSFVAHARATHPGIEFRVESMDDLEVTDLDGILAWYSTIHRHPDEMDAVLARFRRAVRPGGSLVIGFFVGDEVAAFDHKVTTAYRWPPDAMATRLERAGFTEIERLLRPAGDGHRTHGAIAARAIN